MNGRGREVAVVGVGYSEVTRPGAPDIRELTLDSCHGALSDAGLRAEDLDAIFEYSFGGERADSPIATSAQRLLGAAFAQGEVGELEIDDPERVSRRSRCGPISFAVSPTPRARRATPSRR